MKKWSYKREGDNLVVHMYFIICSSEIWNDERGGLIRGIASLEGDNLVVQMYFLHSSEIWNDRGGLTRGALLSSEFIFFSISKTE